MKVKNIKYKVFDLVDKKNSLQTEIAELQNQLITVSEQIRKICHHPENHMVERQRYHEGNYYNRSYTEYWNECTLCGQREDSHIGSRGSYG